MRTVGYVSATQVLEPAKPGSKSISGARGVQFSIDNVYDIIMISAREPSLKAVSQEVH